MFYNWQNAQPAFRMTLIRTVFKNTLALTIANLFSKLIAAIIGILLVRYLGTAGFGEYSAATALAMFFVAFTDLGFGQLIVREGSRNLESLSACLSNALLVRAVLSFAVFALMLIIASHLTSYRDILPLLLILGFCVFLGELHNIFFRAFQASQEMVFTGIFQLVKSILAGTVIYLLIRSSSSLYAIAWGQTIAVAFVTFFIIVFIVRKYSIRFKPKELLAAFKEALPFGLAGMLLLAYLQMPTILLSVLKSKAEVGLFSASFKMIATLYFVPQIISNVIYPILFKLGAEDLEKHQKTYTAMYRFSSSLGIPASLALFLLAEPIVYFLFGTEFGGAIGVLKAVSWLFALQCMSYPLADALTTADFQWHRTFMHMITLGLCLGFCLLLIPHYGALGAGLALLFAELISLCGFQFLTCILLKGEIVLFKNPLTWLSALIMGIIIFALVPRLNFLIVLSIGMLFYFLSLLVIDRPFAAEFGIVIKKLKQ